jgi:hypothetical protein
MSCGLFTSPTEFIIRVDSMVAPPETGSTQTMAVRFFGWVGSDGCSRLTRVERQKNAASLTVRFHGERVGGNCTQMPVPLDHEEQVTPPLQDPFTIIVQQPSGADLTRTVRVR